MRVACIGGGTGGPLLRHLDEAARPLARGRRLRAQPRRRHLRLGRRPLRRGPRQPRRERPRLRRVDPRELRLLGRRRRRVQGRAHRLRRPRLLRHRPDEALLLLQARARELGVDLRFQNDIPESQIESSRRDYDLVVSSDGLNFRTRTLYADHFQPNVDIRKCKFVWLGTRQKFLDAFTFIFKETEKGWLWPRLPVRRRHRDLHRRMLGGDLERLRLRRHVPGSIDRHLRGDLRRRARRHHPHLQRQAHPRLGRISFPRVLCENWWYRTSSCMGDAAATAHFSIGSGTRLALDSGHRARHLPPQRAHPRRRVRAVPERPPPRRPPPPVGGAQLDGVVRGDRALLRPRPRAVHLLAPHPLPAHQPREPPPPRRGLARTAPSAGSSAAPDGGPNAAARRPMFAPFTLRGMSSRTASSSRRWPSTRPSTASPTDWHLVHLGERAKGGAGLVSPR